MGAHYLWQMPLAGAAAARRSELTLCGEQARKSDDVPRRRQTTRRQRRQDMVVNFNKKMAFRAMWTCAGSY